MGKPDREDSMISASGVRKSFQKTRVLDGVNFNVQKGTIFALLGPNGAGKTTLVKILSTLLKPDEGEIRIAGYDLRRQPDAVRRIIGLTGQYAAVDELLTGEENMQMMGRLYRLSDSQTRRRTQELLEQFELIDAARRVAKTYSGGMRRRLDLAISLLASPQVLFLDEPTTGLDPHSRLTLWEIIHNLSSSGVTILLTTQYLEEADRLADKIAVLNQGQIIAEGSAAALKQRVGQEYLELVLADRDDLQSARTVLGERVVHFDIENRCLRVAVENSPKRLKQVLDELEAAAIEVESLELRKPTLNDVFFVMTGRADGSKGREAAYRLENGGLNG